MSEPVASPLRFSWPMRLFLGAILFHMLFRSTGILYPVNEWVVEFDFARMPRPLPTKAELARQAKDASCLPIVDELAACAASLPRYWCPWPEPDTRARIHAPIDSARYAIAWTSSRLQWCENVLGVHSQWAMFSPSTSTVKRPTRARLFYADGSEITVRQRSDPADLTSFSRWSDGKNLGFDPCVCEDTYLRHEACPGYCNYLAHQHATNADGSPLHTIELYQVTYRFPPPGVDTHAYLQDLMAKTRDHRSPLAGRTYYRYSVEKRHGEFLR